jgi:hypothetical protein
MSIPEVMITFLGWGSLFLAIYLINRKRAKKIAKEKSD